MRQCGVLSEHAKTHFVYLRICVFACQPAFRRARAIVSIEGSFQSFPLKTGTIWRWICLLVRLGDTPAGNISNSACLIRAACERRGALVATPRIGHSPVTGHKRNKSLRRSVTAVKGSGRLTASYLRASRPL